MIDDYLITLIKTVVKDISSNKNRMGPQFLENNSEFIISYFVHKAGYTDILISNIVDEYYYKEYEFVLHIIDTSLHSKTLYFDGGHCINITSEFIPAVNDILIKKEMEEYQDMCCFYNKDFPIDVENENYILSNRMCALTKILNKI